MGQANDLDRLVFHQSFLDGLSFLLCVGVEQPWNNGALRLSAYCSHSLWSLFQYEKDIHLFPKV